MISIVSINIIDTMTLFLTITTILAHGPHCVGFQTMPALKYFPTQTAFTITLLSWLMAYIVFFQTMPALK